jgi:hypothetical protein
MTDKSYTLIPIHIFSGPVFIGRGGRVPLVAPAARRPRDPKILLLCLCRRLYFYLFHLRNIYVRYFVHISASVCCERIRIAPDNPVYMNYEQHNIKNVL